MPLELLFLGTGTSAGVPMIGCNCAVCRSTDPRDHRTRPSVLIRYPSLAATADDSIQSGTDPPAVRQWLIDTAPEMRSQVIRHQLNRIDGVMFTHGHVDHVFGIDDLRRFNAIMQSPIDIYAEAYTLNKLRSMFYYIFEPYKNENESFVASLITREIKAGTALDLFGARWTPLRLLHGRLPILGFRIDYPLPPDPRSISGHDTPPHRTNSLAYCTDVSRIPPETYPLLENLDVLVIDALRYRHHPTHLTVDQALEVIDHVQPRRAYLTHIAHDIQHADLESRLPEHVYLSFDGLVITC